ncbi:MAG: hypothetical protein ACOC3X_03420 [Nanoarchaeota archaeon]
MGWFSNDLYAEIKPTITTHSIFEQANNNKILNPTNNLNNPKDKPSPKDWIKKNQIKVHNDKIILEIENAKWSSFADTKSMDPVLDSTAHGLHIIPKKQEDINIGDIVAYESKFTEGTILHRVIEIKADNEGLYYILKGDNNELADPEKVRFSQIKRILVAIIY